MHIGRSRSDKGISPDDREKKKKTKIINDKRWSYPAAGDNVLLAGDNPRFVSFYFVVVWGVRRRGGVRISLCVCGVLG